MEDVRTILNGLINNRDCEPFLDPVAWQELGLYDYPSVIKYPMCLHSVLQNMNSNKYQTVDAVAEDIRRVWNNCMTYNQDGSAFHHLASKLSVKFEADFGKIKGKGKKNGANDQADLSVLSMDLGGLEKVTNDVEPTIIEKQGFAKSLFKISKEELGKVITICDDKCPKALSKNASEDEVEINVDMVFPRVFWEIHEFMKMCGFEDGKKIKKKKQ